MLQVITRGLIALVLVIRRRRMDPAHHAQLRQRRRLHRLEPRSRHPGRGRPAEDRLGRRRGHHLRQRHAPGLPRVQHGG